MNFPSIISISQPKNSRTIIWNVQTCNNIIQPGIGHVQTCHNIQMYKLHNIWQCQWFEEQQWLVAVELTRQ